MPELKELKCPNCGASITVLPGATEVRCEYCGSRFEVGLGADGMILQSELQRMHMEQQRTQLVQQYGSLGAHLDSLETQLRELVRGKQNHVARGQTRDLNLQRQQVIAEM